MSKTVALYHIVFCTKNRRMTIPMQHREDLYRFIWKQTLEMNCKLIRIGGISNHVHILLDLHPSVSLAECLRNLKGISSTWLLRDNRFSGFEGWADGYYAATIAYDDRLPVIEYIKSQETHHLGTSFDDELQTLHLQIGKALHCQDML